MRPASEHKECRRATDGLPADDRNANPSLNYTALTSGMQDQPNLVAEFETRIPMGRNAQAASNGQPPLR